MHQIKHLKGTKGYRTTNSQMWPLPCPVVGTLPADLQTQAGVPPRCTPSCGAAVLAAGRAQGQALPLLSAGDTCAHGEDGGPASTSSFAVFC